MSVLGCAGKSDVLPEDGPTIREIYDEHLAAPDGRAETIQMELPTAPARVHPTVDSERSIRDRFPRLYNPTLVLYVYPHLSGEEGLPIPGYTTVFPLYATTNMRCRVSPSRRNHECASAGGKRRSIGVRRRSPICCPGWDMTPSNRLSSWKTG